MFKFHPKSLALKTSARGDQVYDTIGLRYTLLDNLPLLRRREDTITVTISQAEADQFYGDFYGLLRYLKLPVELYWITSQLNNYTDSTAFDGEVLDIKVPEQSEINRIKTIYLSTHVN